MPAVEIDRVIAVSGVQRVRPARVSDHDHVVARAGPGGLDIAALDREPFGHGVGHDHTGAAGLDGNLACRVGIDALDPVGAGLHNVQIGAQFDALDLGSAEDDFVPIGIARSVDQLDFGGFEPDDSVRIELQDANPAVGLSVELQDR